MKVEFSSAFIKAARNLSGKMLESLKRTILEVKAAEDIKQITDCKNISWLFQNLQDTDWGLSRHIRP